MKFKKSLLLFLYAILTPLYSQASGIQISKLKSYDNSITVELLDDVEVNDTRKTYAFVEYNWVDGKGDIKFFKKLSYLVHENDDRVIPKTWEHDAKIPICEDSLNKDKVNFQYGLGIQAKNSSDGIIVDLSYIFIPELSSLNGWNLPKCAPLVSEDNRFHRKIVMTGNEETVGFKNDEGDKFTFKIKLLKN